MVSSSISLTFPNDGTMYSISIQDLAYQIAISEGIDIESADMFELQDSIQNMPTSEIKNLLKNIAWDELKDIMVYVDTDETISDKEEWLAEAIDTIKLVQG